MGELQHAVGPRGPVALAVALALVVACGVGCGRVVPSGPMASAASAPPAPPSVAASPASASAVVPGSPDAIDAGVGRLVWLADRAGRFGVWTTDLAGGDVRAYLADLDEEDTTILDARPVGDDVALLRELPGRGGTQLWVLSRSHPPRLVMSDVTSFVARGDLEILAVVDLRTTRTIWRVPLDGTEPTSIARMQIPDHGPAVGPFGFAISPDGRTVAAGWVGGPFQVVGPVPSNGRDLGAPLVVADDGRLIATTGRAGEAYLVEGGSLVELAPSDSDPLAIPGTGSVAWASVDEDGGLVAVEVRDLHAGTSETHPAGGPATNVTELDSSHVILEATPFDPLARTITVVDRRGGRSATFEASAPAVD